MGFVFFFFQAEDGIRDDLVTGVQTCALPILDRAPRPVEPPPDPINRGDTKMQSATRPIVHSSGIATALAIAGTIAVAGRSEERRVGKECRSRWSPYH